VISGNKKKQNRKKNQSALSSTSLSLILIRGVFFSTAHRLYLSYRALHSFFFLQPFSPSSSSSSALLPFVELSPAPAHGRAPGQGSSAGSCVSLSLSLLSSLLLAGTCRVAPSLSSSSRRRPCPGRRSPSARCHGSRQAELHPCSSSLCRAQRELPSPCPWLLSVSRACAQPNSSLHALEFLSFSTVRLCSPSGLCIHGAALLKLLCSFFFNARTQSILLPRRGAILAEHRLPSQVSPSCPWWPSSLPAPSPYSLRRGLLQARRASLRSRAAAPLTERPRLSSSALPAPPIRCRAQFPRCPVSLSGVSSLRVRNFLAGWRLVHVPLCHTVSLRALSFRAEFAWVASLCVLASSLHV
jgi:hypothetical protein